MFPRLQLMDLAKKTKIALDETRMEILGAQILLGFQFRGAFEPGFTQLPAVWRYLDLVGLVLMLIAVGLLILPGPYHRVAERGEDSGSLIRLTTVVATMALVPFGLSIGIDVAIACQRIWGDWGAALAGASAALLAALFWLFWEMERMHDSGHAERAASKRHESAREDPGLHEKIDAMLTEARVVLPGAQALLGFQLAMVFTESFERLDAVSKFAHGAALALTTLTIVLLMAPAAYHRIVYAGEDSAEFHRIGGVLVTVSTLPLAAALAIDVSVVAGKVLDSAAGAIGLGATCFAFLIAAWHALPLIGKARLARAGG